MRETMHLPRRETKTDNWKTRERGAASDAAPLSSVQFCVMTELLPVPFCVCSA